MLRALIPLSSVKSVPRSIEFYQKLGFRVRNTVNADGASEPTWASLYGDGAELMIGRAKEPADTSQKPVLFYLYCDDVVAKREELIRAGIAVGPMQYPFYSPGGEFRVEDPDGYEIWIT